MVPSDGPACRGSQLEDRCHQLLLSVWCSTTRSLWTQTQTVGSSLRAKAAEHSTASCTTSLPHWVTPGNVCPCDWFSFWNLSLVCSCSKHYTGEGLGHKTPGQGRRGESGPGSGRASAPQWARLFLSPGSKLPFSVALWWQSQRAFRKGETRALGHGMKKSQQLKLEKKSLFPDPKCLSLFLSLSVFLQLRATKAESCCSPIFWTAFSCS